MIVDTIENLDYYKELVGIPGLTSLIKHREFIPKKVGNYCLDVECGIRYFVQQYKTLPRKQCIFEAHKKYVDLHIVLEGEEAIGYQHVSKNLKIERTYDKITDVTIYATKEVDSYIHLSVGSFAVFFPQDAHLPKLQKNGPKNVFKIVLKIPKSYFNKKH